MHIYSNSCRLWYVISSIFPILYNKQNFGSVNGKKLNEPIYYESETRTQYISNYISTTTKAYCATTVSHKERGSFCVRSWLEYNEENKTMSTWHY